jgi:hypothetical protein
MFNKKYHRMEQNDNNGAGNQTPIHPVQEDIQ